MRKSKGGFGAAKPLPGQKGYNVTESQRLAADALKMEEDLVRVREHMAAEAAQREKGRAKMKDGSRWRSAREDRGSMRKYAQDVRDRPASEKRKAKKPAVCLDAWGIEQVTEWLGRIGLGQHASSFEYNEVSGPMLLSIAPSDLDHLKITEAADRKAFFSNVEQLRRAATPPIKAPSAAVVDDKLLRDTAPAPTKKHWSQLEPLTDKTVVAPASGPVNLADGSFNETESHESFLKALLDWRASDAQPEQEDGGFWTNPLASTTGGELFHGHFDEEKGHEGFVQAVQAWRQRGPNQKETAHAGTAGSPVEAKRSCWHCYQLTKASLVVRDDATTKEFCSCSCRDSFAKEYARFYGT
ncbi:hypothetical protein ACHHYP_15802 [Achlya hypogyna]|uniref:SAM domain-containing protein n=1 Tax=Achlya hypogyna TaxID=1202772 RepID=A0A1V9ZEM3_ACHHY|nr:hypothetical protein ACHHYP_15802 [Achlya hypogyna]